MAMRFAWLALVLASPDERKGQEDMLHWAIQNSDPEKLRDLAEKCAGATQFFTNSALSAYPSERSERSTNQSRSVKNTDRSGFTRAPGFGVWRLG